MHLDEIRMNGIFPRSRSSWSVLVDIARWVAISSVVRSRGGVDGGLDSVMFMRPHLSSLPCTGKTKGTCLIHMIMNTAGHRFTPRDFPALFFRSLRARRPIFRPIFHLPSVACMFIAHATPYCL
jgi:hypothetical protein